MELYKLCVINSLPGVCKMAVIEVVMLVLPLRSLKRNIFKTYFNVNLVLSLCCPDYYKNMWITFKIPGFKFVSPDLMACLFCSAFLLPFLGQPKIFHLPISMPCPLC